MVFNAREEQDIQIASVLLFTDNECALRHYPPLVIPSEADLSRPAGRDLQFSSTG
jgi:hypothetical protein